ncbi:hypothetical protein BCR33DRAFT_716753 [Rhizoclosmatium globosum]|uniref:Uncharacterized protein n=1 Tax=Rhizoclosmatium globosum TaxID=329046 RepID=A0A1Y2CD03_9FUNG|nr:hypothetical protein BCR33DRAFT_716753 [Rhizoclosmatium globosum]|eukprot:ORY44806.1 hypothetical protein BCR33DRAFT_716753 [Rhizoclosmatium globosum]
MSQTPTPLTPKLTRETSLESLLDSLAPASPSSSTSSSPRRSLRLGPGLDCDFEFEFGPFARTAAFEPPPKLEVPHKTSARIAFRGSIRDLAASSSSSSLSHSQPTTTTQRGRRQRMNCLTELDRPNPVSLELSPEDELLLLL